MTRFSVNGGEVIGVGGVVIGRIVGIDIELVDPSILQQSLTPTQVRELTSCPFCDAEQGEMCDRWRGGTRKMNHAERVRRALEIRATLSADPGATGNSVVSGGANVSTKEENQVKRPTTSQIERNAVNRIWAAYVEIFKSRRVLDDKRTRIIKNALRITRPDISGEGWKIAEEIVTNAVRGLSVSPWHNGSNPRNARYNEIRYALKGIGDESDDERIEKMVTLNAIHGSGSFSIPTAPERIERWLDAVRYSLQFNSELERGREAYKELIARGFTIDKFPRAPWARLHR